MKKKVNKISKIDKSGLFIIVLVVLCFMVTVLAVGILNGGILKGVMWSSDYRSYYLLSMLKFDDLSLAEESAKLNKEQGGAGFILKLDDDYHLIASIYNTKDDAEAVKAKQIDAEIVEIFLPKLNGSKAWHEKANIEIIDKCYCEIGDIIKGLVLEEITTQEAKDGLLFLLGKLSLEKETFENTYDGNDSEQEQFLINLKVAMSYVESVRQNLTLSDLRYIQIGIVALFCVS